MTTDSKWESYSLRELASSIVTDAPIAVGGVHPGHTTALECQLDAGDSHHLQLSGVVVVKIVEPLFSARKYVVWYKLSFNQHWNMKIWSYELV